MSINIIEYWLTSLVDSDRISGSEEILGSFDKYVESQRHELADGQLSVLDCGQLSQLFKTLREDSQKQNPKKQPNLDGEVEGTIDNKVLICPLLLVEQDKSSLKGSLVPLWIPAIVELTGKLRPDPDVLPWLSRQLLSPQDSELAMGDVETFNKFLCDRQCPTEDWADYWQFCVDLLAKVTGMGLAEFNLLDLHIRPMGVILPNILVLNTTGSVRGVYNHLIKYRKKLTPILKKLTDLTDRPIDPLLTAAEQKQQSHRHLGQMTGDYPLSISQRESLYHFFKIQRGEILAINGPPGTGKTTLLQSVISSLWVEKALKGDEPPIIVASSANNQAVTNIIASFGAIGQSDDLLSQRWLPQMSSYGLYLASTDKFRKQKDSGWQMLTAERQGLMAQMETAEQHVFAHGHFLQKCQEFFQQPISTLTDALGLLHNRLQETVTQMYQQLAVRDIQDIERVQADLDRQHRHQAFQLATHYWEGRWLRDCEDLPEKPSEHLQESDWYRYAKLTPCFVSTFYMVPKFFRAYESNFNKPMYEFIDLLIVDEAGQASPEIAGASFALAKLALVVGDTIQIEPVWSIPQAVDNGNLYRHEIAIAGEYSKPFEPDQFAILGLSAANGSVMKIAQRASRYQKFPEQRGMFLSEHRRCLDEIITYCNQLCYHGKLEPMRGSLSPEKFIPLADGFILPPMGYLHIPGKSEKFGSSRRNEIEAQTIAHWIAIQKDALIEHYQKPLSEIIGVVTPFKQQSIAISNALAERGIKDVTVGTVHALQGAERAIVIFSAVYDNQQAQTFFFDRQPNLLNVAVSRAKDSFLVFGDRYIFKVDESIPSGLLAKFLFASESNALPKLTISEAPLPIRLRSVRRVLPDKITTLSLKSTALQPENSPQNIGASSESSNLVDSGETIDATDQSKIYFDEALEAYCYYKYNNDGEWSAEDAIYHLNFAIEFNHDNAQCWSLRGSLYFELKEYQKVIYDCTKAIEINSNNTEDWYNRGDSYYVLKNYRKAIDDYIKAINLNSNNDLYWNDLTSFNHHNENCNSVYWNRRGNAYYNLKQYQEAVEDYSKAIELSPNNATYWSNRGDAYSKLNEYHKAIEDFSKAIQINYHSDKSTYLEEIGETFYHDPYSGSEKYNQSCYHNSRGNIYSQLNEYQKAIDDFNEAIELYPTNAKCWNNRGNAFRLISCDKFIEYKEKIDNIHIAEMNYWDSIESSSISWNYYRKPINLKSNQYEQAVEDYSKAIQFSPDNAEYWNNRGIAYFKSRQYLASVEDHTKAIEINPNNAEYWDNRGLMYYYLAQAQKAFEDFSQAIELNPNNASYWNHRGDVYYNYSSQYGEAVDDYSKAIELNPNEAKYWNNRGITHFNLSQFQQAVDDYSRAIELDPNNVTYLDNRGILYSKLTEYQKAVDDYSKLIAINPNESAYWNERGKAHSNLNQFEKAMEDYKKAIELTPKIDTIPL
jgi:tetratricopeptide (TPR) repeat protein